MRHLFPSRKYLITTGLVYSNVLVFLLMVLTGNGFFRFDGPDLVNWGANYRPVTTDGEWWRLVTCMFLHGGLMHMVTNMLGLLFIGLFLEPLLGRFKLVSVYLLTGIVASLTSLWWHDAVISVGASGAIMGLYGVFIGLLLNRVFPLLINKLLLFCTIVFVGYNLISGLSGGIDNAAHIGGLASGVGLGLLFSPVMKRTR